MSPKPHLDDFFRAARSEQPVTSHDDVRELIQAHSTHSTTQHFTWKGMGMTTLGLGLASVLTFFALHHVEQAKDQQPHSVTQTVSDSQTQRVENTPSAQPQVLKANVMIPKFQREDLALRAPVSILVEPPISIDEMKITEPDEDDMKRLGMKIDERGSLVVVVQKVGRKFFVVNYRAKPFKVSTELEEENPTDIEPTEVLPVFVTNLDGTGILTATATDENTSIATKELRHIIQEGDVIRKENVASVVIKSEDMGSGSSTEAGDLDVNVEVTDDGDAQEPGKARRKMVRVRVNENGPNGPEEASIMIDDEAHRALLDSMKNVKIHIIKHKGDLEELAKQLEVHHQQLEDVKVHILNSAESVKGSLDVLDNLHELHAKVRIPTLNDLKAKVNELIPVRVRLVEEKGKGLIFWYDPSVAPKGQHQVQSVALKGSFATITVNPNPARDLTTLRFTLKDAHAMTVTVHDILGRRLIEAGQFAAEAGQEALAELNLSSLNEGVYLVVLTTDSGEQHIERILVQK